MTSPYLRAAAKFSQLKLQAKERLDKRQGKPDKPEKPTPPKPKPTKPPKSK